jgi:hypothetical protein
VSAAIARRGQLRTAVAAAILVAWGGGVALLVRREFYVPNTQRLAEAALRISPGATFYTVEQNGVQVGFASNTIDTLTNGIDVVDYIIADFPVGGKAHRTSTRSVVKLSRGLALRSFDIQVSSDGAPYRAGGRADGDSAIVYAISPLRQPSDSQSVFVHGGVLLPALLPLAISLGDTPKTGRGYSFAVFDPSTMKQETAKLTVRAESLFTVVDSATFDIEKGEWVAALTDTVRAWRVEPQDSAGGFTGWIDAQGRPVQSTRPGGVTLKRVVYEIAFENWRIARDRATATAAGSGANDILERTAISAHAKLGGVKLTALTVRLSAVDLRGYDLDGGRQSLRGDTLRIRRERDSTLVPSWSLLKPPPGFKAKFKAELAGEPLLQTGEPAIVNLAVRIAGGDRDARVIAQKINAWVYDSLKKEATFSVPNAIDVLRRRRGDANEHTQLYVALARTLGIPARAATGLAYVDGKFYYHAWPEVYLADWVAVDPTFGEFPASAAHLRFVVGGLSRQTELLQLIGNLKIRVLEAK